MSLEAQSGCDLTEVNRRFDSFLAFQREHPELARKLEGKHVLVVARRSSGTYGLRVLAA